MGFLDVFFRRTARFGIREFGMIRELSTSVRAGA